MKARKRQMPKAMSQGLACFPIVKLWKTTFKLSIVKTAVQLNYAIFYLPVIISPLSCLVNFPTICIKEYKSL